MESKELTADDGAAATSAEPAPVFNTSSMVVSDNDCGSSQGPVGNASCNVNNISETSPSASKRVVDKELRQPFPVKVYEMLENADLKKFSHIVSWNQTGTGFMVHDKEHFTREIVPHYFNLTKYKSFQRQLSLYGFQRVTVGPNKGLRYHDKLRKGEVELVRQMKPVGYKPRNLARLLEQQKQKQQQQQQQQQPGNVSATATTTVVNSAITVNNPSNQGSTGAIVPVGSVSTITVVPVNPIPEASCSINLPPVVSTNSLVKHEDQDSMLIEGIHQFERQANNSHTVSPDPVQRNSIQISYGVGNGTMYSQVPGPKHTDGEKQGEMEIESEIGYFEGMCFYPMSPTRELGINVKLKLLEEFNPTSSLLRLASKYVTPGYATKPIASSVTTVPVTIDAVYPDRPSLLEPFTDLINTAAAASTASTIAALQKTATSTASTIAALQTSDASAAGLATGTQSSSSTPSLLSASTSDVEIENRCTDALDFHTMGVTNLTSKQQPEQTVL